MRSSAGRGAEGAAGSAILGAGPRVYIRHATPSDVPAYAALRDGSRRFLRRWEPRPPNGVPWNDPARLIEDFTLRARAERHEKLLILRRGDDALLGFVGVSEIVRGPFLSAYIGYFIGEEFAGQGYMSEGLALVLDYVFGPLGLHRVEANIQPVNEPSRALARTLGFRCEGYSPQYLKIAGRWADHERWSILAREWKAGRRAVWTRLRAKAREASAR